MHGVRRTTTAAASRLTLVLLVVEGYIYLGLVMAIFAAAPAFLIWGLVARRPLIAVAAILAGVPVLTTTGRAIRALWLAPSDVDGVEVTPRSSAQLHATVQALARAVGAPRVHRILVGRAHNASALQVRFGWIPWRRNTLILGYSLLATLSRDQMHAVIAHELAHLTHKHGRFSGAVHRTRRMWVQLLYELNRHRSLPAHVSMLYRFYVPRLDRQAAAVSRRHEMIADRLAAEVAGAEAAAQALVAIEIGNYVLEQGYWTRFYDRVRQEPDVPNPYAAMSPRVWSEVDGKQEVMNRLLSAMTEASDTHPVLRDRLRAINQVPQWPKAPATSAAEELLGPNRSEVVEALAHEWMHERGPDWRRRHDDLRRRRERIAALEAGSSPTGEETFEYGSLLEEDGRVERALDEYRRAHAAGHAAAGFAAGRLLLDRGDQKGVALIEAAMEADATLSEEGCRTIVDYLEARGRHADAHRFQARLNKEAAVGRIAQRERERLSVVDRFAPSEAEVDRAALARIMRPERRVLRAYLVSKQLRHSRGMQTILAVFSKNDELPDLAERLYNGRVLTKRVAVVVLGRHNEQIESVLRDVPGALVFER
jgi:Zn-dependent protease with chaperone function